MKSSHRLIGYTGRGAIVLTRHLLGVLGALGTVLFKTEYGSIGFQKKIWKCPE